MPSSSESVTAITRSMFDIESFEPAARDLFDICKRAIGATACYLALPSTEGRSQVLYIDRDGQSCRVDPGLSLPVCGLQAKACRDAKAVYDNRFSGSHECLPYGQMELKNVLFAPLAIDAEVVGLLGLVNKPLDFNADDVAIVETLGHLAALALRRTRIDEKSEQVQASLVASEEKFHSRHLSITLNAIGDAVISTDAQGCITMMNPIAEQMLGWSFSAVRGRALSHLFVIVHERTRQPVVDPVTKVLREEPMIDRLDQAILISRDGSEYFIDISAAPIRSDRGLLIGAVLIFRNVTEKRYAEQHLMESQEELDAIYNNAPFPLMLVDHEQRVLKINGVAGEFAGRPASEMIGLRVGEALRCLDAVRSTEGCGFDSNCRQCTMHLAVADTLDTGCSHHQVETNLPFRLKDQDQQLTFLVSTTQLIVREEPMVLVSIMDITRRKQAEEALRESEERFKMLFSNVPVPYQSLDEEGHFIEVNPAWLNILGYRREEVIGRSFLDFLNPEWQTHFKTQFSRFKARGEGMDIEYEMVKKNGDRLLASFTGKADHDTHGRFKQTHCIFQDITAQRRAQSDLAKLVEAVRQASDGVVVTEKDGIITYVNPAFEQISGFSHIELLGRTPRIFKSGLQDQAFYKQLWDTIMAGKRWSGRIVDQRKDGRHFTADCSITPVVDSDGRIVNFVWLTRDVTEAIRLEERLQQAQKMEAIGTLAGGIAHDFNNMLFPLVGFAEMLQEDLPADSPLQENVSEILHAALRSRDLVQQILAFSRKAERRDRPIRLQSIVKEAVKLLRASIPTTIDIRQQIDGDCPMVIADPTHVHQIVMNLATNAYHAMEEKGGLLRLDLEAVNVQADPAAPGGLATGRYAHLQVSDTGVGMTREILSRVFDPYFTTKSDGKGTGLGLSVVHGIVAIYSGEVRINSEPGVGTQVHVYLPVVEKKTMKEAPVPSKMVRGGVERILLVDDEDVIMRMEQQMLMRLGYQVTARTASVEALAAFRANPAGFDLLLTDMTMPNMTGIQLAAAVKAIRPDVPIIICTGFSEQLDEAKCAAHGIAGYLMKPVVSRAVAETIRKVLDGKEPNQP